MRKFLIGSAAFLGLTAAASAADYARPAPPMAPVFTWTGLYIGANAGGIWADGGFADNCFGNDAQLFTFPCQQPLSPNGRDNSSWLAGGQIGYNYQFRGWGGGSWVFGAEADLQATDLSRSANIFLPGVLPIGTLAPVFGNNLTYRASSEIDWFGTVRGRLGFAWDRLLVYGTGGAIFANVQTTHFLDRFFLTATANGQGPPVNVSAFGSHDSIVPGWIAGGGIEYAFWNNVSLKVEAAYYELQPTHAGNRDFVNFNFNSPLNANRTLSDINTHGYLVRGGINWRFWGM
jgi:outer membrane immunogenic protein